MSFYVAYPADLVKDLIDNLPAEMREEYAEHFTPVVGDLIWIVEDVENALDEALQSHSHPLANTWFQDSDIKRELVRILMAQEYDALTGMVRTELESMAALAVSERIRLEETAPPANDPM